VQGRTPCQQILMYSRGIVRSSQIRSVTCYMYHVNLQVDKEAYMRGICEGVEQHLWSSDSRPAYRGICAFPVSRCTAVRAVGCGLLTEESEVKARWAGYFERMSQADPPTVELDVRVSLSLLLTLQSTVIHLCLWKHRLR